jgi:hypothetical protein
MPSPQRDRCFPRRHSPRRAKSLPRERPGGPARAEPRSPERGPGRVACGCHSPPRRSCPGSRSPYIEKTSETASHDAMFQRSFSAGRSDFLLRKAISGLRHRQRLQQCRAEVRPGQASYARAAVRPLTKASLIDRIPHRPHPTGAGGAAMRRCGDAAMRRCGDAAMRRCANVRRRRRAELRQRHISSSRAPAWP